MFLGTALRYPAIFLTIAQAATGTGTDVRLPEGFDARAYWDAIHVRGTGRQKPSHEAGFVRWLAPAIDAAPEIVVFSDAPFVGDTLVFAGGVLEELRERFPGKRIRFITPVARIFQRRAWLEPQALPLLDSLRIPGSMAGALERAAREVPPGAFWFVVQRDRSDFAEDVIQRLGLRREDSYDPKREAYEKWIAPYHRKLDEILKEATGPVWRADGFNPTGKIPGSDWFEVRQAPDVFAIRRMGAYDQTLGHLWPLFGSGFRLRWARDLLYAPGSRAGDLARLVGKADSGFLVLNLNTAGTWKTEGLRELHGPSLREILSHVDRRYPGIPVLVTPSEPQLGREVAEEALTIIGRSRNAILLPANDRDLWQEAIAQARAVVTQDSGFAHVALAIRERGVMTLSLSPDGSAETWRKRNTPFYAAWSDAIEARARGRPARADPSHLAAGVARAVGDFLDGEMGGPARRCRSLLRARLGDLRRWAERPIGPE